MRHIYLNWSWRIHFNNANNVVISSNILTFNFLDCMQQSFLLLFLKGSPVLILTITRPIFHNEQYKCRSKT